MKRISQLDGLRGSAILMIFIYHVFNAPLLWTGVDLFFVLSGYLITGILLRLKERKATGGADTGFFGPFYLRRARRILPPYAGFLIMVTLFFSVPWMHVWYWYAFFAANVANAVHRVPVEAMGPLWSLAVEEQFYFLWPWVVLRANQRTLKHIALGVVIAAPILRTICTPFLSSSIPMYALTPFRADTLACGAFIAISEIENPAWVRMHRRLASICAITAAIAIAALSLTLHSFRHDLNTVVFNSLGYSLFVVVFGGTLIWVLGSGKDFTSAVLNFKPLRYLGVISYTFYLYHRGVILLVERGIHSRVLVFIVSFVILTALSSISWFFFESRILGVRPLSPVSAKAAS
jgi:peptidoglycan/LPS O-acetylase OafA/YrhL